MYILLITSNIDIILINIILVIKNNFLIVVLSLAHITYIDYGEYQCRIILVNNAVILIYLFTPITIYRDSSLQALLHKLSYKLVHYAR